MRYMLAAISTIALVAASLAQAPVAPAVIVIRAGMLIDGKSGEPRHDQVIIVRGDGLKAFPTRPARKRQPARPLLIYRKLPFCQGLSIRTRIFSFKAKTPRRADTTTTS